MTTYFEELKRLVENNLSELNLPNAPANLYEPISYMLSLGGKRIRPILTLMACEFFGSKKEAALSQALAVEVFHNFTLVHDDIMDSANVRRNLPTVHKKWDHNIALLSGDGMIVLAYQKLFEASSDNIKKLADVFNKTALEVCEGQQLDMDYAQAESVSTADYLNMIRLKTAVLLGGAMKLGAIVAGANDQQQSAIYSFAENLGLAFQIRDDYLDAFGTEDAFGKTIGGDIKEGKRTWLTTTAFEVGNKEQVLNLSDALNNPNLEKRFQDVIAIYTQLDIPGLAIIEIEKYSALSLKALSQLDGEESTREKLMELVDYLMGRQS